MLHRILLAGFLASALLFAQGGKGGGKGGGGANVPSMPFGGGTRLDRISDALKFTKDQKKDVKAAMDDAQKEAIPVHDQMTRSHLAIAEAIAAGKSQDEIDKAVRGQAELESQMTSIELHAFAKVVSFLEADQKQRGIPSLFAMVRGAFLGKNWNSDN
jgi:hypothetical protein